MPPEAYIGDIACTISNAIVEGRKYEVTHLDNNSLDLPSHSQPPALACSHLLPLCPRPLPAATMYGTYQMRSTMNGANHGHFCYTSGPKMWWSIG
jgi:hypothetical protein